MLHVRQHLRFWFCGILTSLWNISDRVQGWLKDTQGDASYQRAVKQADVGQTPGRFVGSKLAQVQADIPTEIQVKGVERC